MSDDEFRTQFEQCSDALWCFVCSRAPHRADDICQETWLKAWQKRKQFQGGNFKGWLFRIAQNLLIDASRKKAILPLSEEHPTADPHATDPLDELLDRERKTAVQECMKTLAEQEAAVVKMRTAGLSYAEIAKALNVTEARAQTLYHQGKNKLKSCVERKLP